MDVKYYAGRKREPFKHLITTMSFGGFETACGQTILPRESGKSTENRPLGFEYCADCARIEDAD